MKKTATYGSNISGAGWLENELKHVDFKGSSEKRVGKQKYIAINAARLECNNIVTFYPGVLWN